MKAVSNAGAAKAAGASPASSRANDGSDVGQPLRVAARGARRWQKRRHEDTKDVP